ncbi:penicillin-binding protein 2 [Myxococcota bacterium]|nr:penicillin-binding protein 2 [Myxococcota bacterium]MBU1431082.1 penicillin-binding protein 2 [Myxococcota bacterium]MBU1896526.1 penicillin-binding protein 2 [Myxococcota bacterium]
MADYLDSSAVGYQKSARRLMLIAALAFSVLLLRLAHLQFIEGRQLKGVSVHNFARRVDLPANRGSIYDRKGRLLAVSRPSFDLYITPAQVKDIDVLLEGLGQVIELDALDILKLKEKVLQRQGNWRYKGLLVARDIGRKHVALAEDLRSRVAGISIQVRYQREYPMGEIGAHLLGYLGRPRPDELGEGSPYRNDSMLGRFGLEKKLEETLRGEDGFERYVVNARGARKRGGWAERALEGLDNYRPPQRGHDVVLTIDADLQRILANALEGFESGAAVVLEPDTGAVLGIISKPSFDPNEWSGRLSFASKQAIDDNPYNPMLDKSVHSYFPGSIYKPMTALAALEEGVLDPELPIESPGSYEFGNRIFHCHKRSGHGAVDLNAAMAASADVYFYKLGEQLGIDTLARYARRFGFGQRTALGINGESAGIVPTKAHHDKNTRGGFQYGLALSTAIGQGDVRTTPLQMAMAYAALANGGVLYSPRVIDHIRTEDQREISRTQPIQIGTLEARPDHLAAIKRALERAVNDPKRATGHHAAIPYGVIAGKTGTAQVRKIVRGMMRQSVNRFQDRDHAWFAAFAPYDNPKLVVIIFLEHGGSGGKDAAPIARRVFEAYHQQIEPIFQTEARLGR